MMKKTLFGIFLISLILLSCGRSSAFPVSVEDESGTRFTILSQPKRIISTMPSNTEILFELGLGKRVVGCTDACNFPLPARYKEKIGGVKLNTEKITMLNPDIIFMLGDAQMPEIEKFRSYDLPVFVINPHSLNDVISSIKLIGTVTGTEKKAQEIVDEMNYQIKGLMEKRKNMPPKKIFVVLYPNPLITAGKGTFINDLIEMAGGINIAGNITTAPYPVINFEKVLTEDPEFIIVAGKSIEELKTIKNNKRWANIKAIKENKVLLIDSDIVTRPTPRLVHAFDMIVTFLNSTR